MTEAREALQKISELLETSGSWVPKKPEKTVYSLAHDISNKTLQPGRWTKVFSLPEKYSPYLVYWKILIANNPKLKCLCYENGKPVCHLGCDLKGLFDLGVWQYNDRGWVHIYDTTENIYGLQCNIIRPIVGTYDFFIQNYDSAPHTLTYLYFKWYQWQKEHTVLER